jgi:GTPase SAR1 family protein
MDALFMQKYQPTRFCNFEMDSELISVLKTMVEMNSLNILFIGDVGSGKTSFINALIQEYYAGKTK